MPPKLKRATTMQQTVAAGESFLSRKRGAPYSAAAPSAASSSQAPAPAKKAKLSKQQTMKSTAKEGKALTAGKCRGKTRGKTATKKPKLSKQQTMKNTAAEGQALVGKKKLGATRGKTASKPKVKRQGTMQATAQASLSILPSDNAYFSGVKNFVSSNLAKK